jgi:hypothetical protein
MVGTQTLEWLLRWRPMAGGGGGAATAPDDGLTTAVMTATGVEVRVRGLEGIHRRWL